MELKKIIAVLILISALSYSGFVFFHSSSLFGLISNHHQIAVDNSIPTNPLSGKNPLSLTGVDGAGNVNGVSLPVDNNFTQQFVQALQQKAVAKQQGKDIDLSGAKFNLSLIDSIDDSVIKISIDNSKAAKKKYLQVLSDISVKDRGSFNKNVADIVDAAYHDLDSSLAGQAALIYKNTAQDFSAVPVPSDWKDFHKRFIVYLENVSVIYSAIANYQNDPIKGYLAFEKIKEYAVSGSGFDLPKLVQAKLKEIQ